MYKESSIPRSNPGRDLKIGCGVIFLKALQTWCAPVVQQGNASKTSICYKEFFCCFFFCMGKCLNIDCEGAGKAGAQCCEHHIPFVFRGNDQDSFWEARQPPQHPHVSAVVCGRDGRTDRWTDGRPGARLHSHLRPLRAAAVLPRRRC